MYKYCRAHTVSLFQKREILRSNSDLFLLSFGSKRFLGSASAIYRRDLQWVITGFQKPPGMFLSHHSRVGFWPRFQEHPFWIKSIPFFKNLPGSIYFHILSPAAVQYSQIFSPTVVQNSPIGNNPSDRRDNFEVQKHPAVITQYY